MENSSLVVNQTVQEEPEFEMIETVKNVRPQTVIMWHLIDTIFK